MILMMCLLGVLYGIYSPRIQSFSGMLLKLSRIPIRGPLNIDIREFLSLVSYRRVDSIFLVF